MPWHDMLIIIIGMGSSVVKVPRVVIIFSAPMSVCSVASLIPPHIIPN